MKYQVSVVVLSYNPVFQKLKTTLKRIIEQRGINIEIIVCDDCSTKDDFFYEIRRFFDENCFCDYKLVRNNENLGIVNNFYCGVLNTSGEYVFMTSPGDYLYAENTLKCFYDFAKKQKAEICFGNAVYYSLRESGIKLVNGKYNSPAIISVWESCDIEKQKDVFFLLDDHILGATILRSRENAIKYLLEIRNLCRYIEDNTMLMFSLMDNVVVYHYDEYILWYEYGTGISTSSTSSWDLRIKKDFKGAYLKLFCEYKDEKKINFAILSQEKIAKLRRMFIMLIKFPKMYFRKKCYCLYKKFRVNYKFVDVSCFPKID